MKRVEYGVFSCPYFPVFGLNTRKYGPEETPYLDTFHAVKKTDDNTKITQIENEIPSVTGLDTITAD